MIDRFHPWQIPSLLLLLCGAVSASSVDVRSLHQQGQYAAAASAGLNTLLSEPWNHESRFLVADSLERSCDIAGAESQFRTLSGTTFAEHAQIRLNNLLPLTHKTVTHTNRVQIASSAGSRFQAFEVPREQVIPPIESRPAQRSSLRDQIKLPKQPSEIEAVYKLNTEGAYREAAQLGKKLIQRGLADDDLKLIVANSLAWTGQSDEAIPAYKDIIQNGASPAKVNDARAGLGNVLRWNGRDDQAMPLYQKALADDPKHAASLDGVMYAERELRPKTTITFGQSEDSGKMERRGLGINHRWRDRTMQHGFEVEFAGVNDNLLTDNASQRELTLRYQAFAKPLQPRLWMSTQVNPTAKLFAGAQFQLIPQKLSVEIDYLNWGLRANNPRAINRGLTAGHFGLAGRLTSQYGDLNAAVDYYDISDSNHILTSSLRYTAPGTFLGFRAFVGAENREPKFSSPDYWSPALGYGAYFGGLQGGWSKENWELFLAGQIGRPIYGDAGKSSSLSGGGRLWLTRDFAVGLRLWDMSSWRDGATYKAKSATLSLESLW